MGTYSVLLIDGPLTDEQQSVLRQRAAGLCRLESNWDFVSRRVGLDAPLTAADRTFWTLDTGINYGAGNWEFVRSEFVDTIRAMVPGAAVYLTRDHMLEENVWTRAQWLDIAEGRRTEIHPSHVELLTDEAIAEWDSAAADKKIESAVRFLSHRLGTPTEFSKNTDDQWAPVIREVIKALDDAS